MRNIDFLQCVKDSAPATTKVSGAFVSEIKEAFNKLPKLVNMRYKQIDMKLVVTITVTYLNHIVQTLEGFADEALIDAILPAMEGELDALSEYMKTEHDICVAKEGEDLVLELFKQYLSARMRVYIDKDWYNNNGERYRTVTFTPCFENHIKFCLKATDEVNNLIEEACKTSWLHKPNTGITIIL